MNMPPLYAAYYPHEIHCTRPDCVLPSCVNQKLQKLMKNNNPGKAWRRGRCLNLKLQKNNTNTSKTKRKPGRKPKISVCQNTKLDVEAEEDIKHAPWEEELEDILSILGVDNYDVTANDDVFMPSDGTDQQYPVSHEPAFGQELYRLEDSQKPPISSPFNQPEQVNPSLHLEESQGIPRPGPKIQSKSPLFPVSAPQPMEIDLIDLGEIASYTLDASVTDGTNQSADIARARNVPRFMNRAVRTRKASPAENSLGQCSSRKNQLNRRVQHPPDREETRNDSYVKRKITMNDQQTTSLIQESPNKLFGILSLILQAFNRPGLTTELEECYTGVLQRALMEIRANINNTQC